MRGLWLLLVPVALLAGCDRAKDVAELKDGQAKILAKLTDLEKAVQQVKVAAPAAAAQSPDPNKVYTIPVGSSPTRGPREAKVTLVEFADYQCPFCAQTTPLVDQVLQAYPKDVNFVFKNFPLPATMHPNAMPAAKAAVAAGKQGKYWEMHDILFKNSRALGMDQIKGYAGEIGLDVPKWESDFNSPAVQAQVDQELADGRSAGVRGTPTFFINGKVAQGRSIEAFKQQIDAALGAKGGPTGG